MKKIATPLIHAAFLVPLLILSMGFIELMAQTFELLPNYIAIFEVPYAFLTITIILILGIPLFLIANRIMKRLENNRKPNVYDHFRQSIFFYFIISYCIITWMFFGFKNSQKDLYFLFLAAFSLISIMINYILFRRRWTNFS